MMNNAFKTIIRLAAGAALVAVIWSGCTDNPVEPADEHFEARGVVLRMNGMDTVVVDSNRLVHGRIVVQEGTLSQHISLQFIREEDGTRAVPPEDDTDMRLGWTIADTTIAGIEHDEEDGEWAFHIEGRKVGETTIVLRIIHVDHPDFQSIPIPIEVIP